jgi:uncharacterized membrane protein
MSRYTGLLRLLLALVTVVVAMGCGLLYVVSLDLAASYPEVAHLRVPIFLAVVACLVPGLVAVHALWMFLGLVDRDEAFSEGTVRLLRRIRLCFGAMAACLLVSVVAVCLALLPLQSPSVPLAWFGGEVVAVFLFTFAALLERLFSNAVELRQDNELTV